VPSGREYEWLIVRVSAFGEGSMRSGVVEPTGSCELQCAAAAAAAGPNITASQPCDLACIAASLSAHRLAPKDKVRFVKQCQPGVFRYDEGTDVLSVANARKARNIDEIRKIGMVRAL
jgi:hypothetical protein